MVVCLLLMRSFFSIEHNYGERSKISSLSGSLQEYKSHLTGKPVYGFRPGPTQTRLYNYSRFLQA